MKLIFIIFGLLWIGGCNYTPSNHVLNDYNKLLKDHKELQLRHLELQDNYLDLQQYTLTLSEDYVETLRKYEKRQKQLLEAYRIIKMCEQLNVTYHDSLTIETQ